MALSLYLGEQGHEPESIETQVKAQMRQVEGAPTITKMAIATRARVPGIDQEALQKAAEASKENCIVSRALAGVPEITLEATLES